MLQLHGCYWHLAYRDQGCCQTSYNAQERSPATKNDRDGNSAKVGEILFSGTVALGICFSWSQVLFGEHIFGVDLHGTVCMRPLQLPKHARAPFHLWGLVRAKLFPLLMPSPPSGLSLEVISSRKSLLICPFSKRTLW